MHRIAKAADVDDPDQDADDRNDLQQPALLRRVLHKAQNSKTPTI